jgi:hypothetical protein
MDTKNVSKVFSFSTDNRQYYCLKKPEYPQKPIDLSQVTDKHKFYHIKLYRVHLAMNFSGDRLVHTEDDVSPVDQF